MNAGLAGFRPLLRATLRHERIKIPAWVLGVTAMTAYMALAIPLAFPDAADLAVLTQFMAGPAGIVMSGPGFGFDDPSPAVVFAGVYGMYLMIGAALMSILLAVRLTRGQEESGQLEMVLSGVVSRPTPVAVAAVELVLANLLLWVFTWGITAAFHPPRSSALFSAGLAAVGLVFGAVALLIAQLTQTARGATGISFALLAIAVVVRGVGDVLEPGGSALSWLSPIAWSQQTRVYADDRWWPLGLSVLTAAVCLAFAILLQRGRDLGSGLLPVRSGRTSADGLLRGQWTLTMRLGRAFFLWWTVAVILFALAYGALAGQVVAGLSGMEDNIVVQILGGPGHMLNGYLGICLFTFVIMTACYAISSIHRLAADESNGIAELTLSRPVSRQTLIAAHTVTSFLGSAVMIILGGGVLGWTSQIALSTVDYPGDDGLLATMVQASLNYLPALAVICSVAALGYAIRPVLINLSWALIGYSLLIGMVGSVLKLPKWAENISPFAVTGMPPLTDVEWSDLVLLSIGTLGLFAVALVVFGRRDLRPAN